jgi:VanZ family protein
MTSTGDPLYGMRMSLKRGVGLWLPPLALMALIFFLSSQPDLSSGLGTWDLVLRKIVHFAVYGLLCFLLWFALRAHMEGRRAALVALAIASAYAVTDEWHQTLVEGRHGTPVDWLIDTAGAGIVAVRLRAMERRRQVVS